MQTLLLQTKEHTLTLEKVAGSWWLELIERATGQARIMHFGRRDKAIGIFDRMGMPDIVRVYDKLNIEAVPMYKPDVV